MQESETIEYKKSLAELSDGLNSIAAILNKHGRGALWFGIKTTAVLLAWTFPKPPCARCPKPSPPT